MRRKLNRFHVWLGWLIGVPLLIWTATGLWMTSRPIDEVRGVQLKADEPALSLQSPVVFPLLHGKYAAIQSIRLEQQWAGPVWIVAFADGQERRASAAEGQWLSPVSEAEARSIADSWYKPKAAIVSARKSPANASPLDLRRERPAWGIAFTDGANVYVDADTGSLLAIRSKQWRLFDFMWRLHIMDLQTREETSHPLLIFFAALATVGVFLGLVLLPLASGWRGRKRSGKRREAADV